MAEHQADLRWARLLRSGEDAAWERYRCEVEPFLPLMPGFEPARQFHAIRAFLRGSHALGRDPLSEYRGRVPLGTWVQAASIRLECSGVPPAPIRPVEVRAASACAAAELFPEDRVVLGERYLEGIGPFERARRKAADGTRATAPVFRALRHLRRRALDLLDPRLEATAREEWLAGQSLTAADAAVRALVTERSGLPCDAPGGGANRTAPDPEDLFRHLTPEWLACEALGQPLPPEQQAHLTTCTRCHRELAWLLRHMGRRRGRRLALASKTAAVLSGVFVWGALLLSGSALDALGSYESAAWTGLRRAAANHDELIRPIQAYLEEARRPMGGHPSGAGVGSPSGTERELPDEALLFGLEPGEPVELHLHAGDVSQTFVGKADRISLTSAIGNLPCDRELILTIAEPERAAGAGSRFQLPAAAARQGLLYERRLQAILLRTLPERHTAVRVALALEHARNGEAYAQVRSAWPAGATNREDWALIACAARRVGDVSLRDRAVAAASR